MSNLRPREIQVRIRSGESPEQVAEAAQTTVEKIAGYVAPVLAERAYVAQQAMKASVRRRAGDGPVGALGDAVASRLEATDLDPDAVTWDAWRREDGRWTVVVDLAPGAEPRRAQFCYDTAGRYVLAEDDEARWLVSERSAVTASAAPLPDRVGEQIELGDDAIEVVTGRPLTTVGALAGDDATQDLTDTVQALRPTVVQPLSARTASAAGPAAAPAGPAAPDAGRDWMLTQASERPVTTAPAPNEPRAEVSPPAPAPDPAEVPDALFDTEELRAEPDSGPDDQPAPTPGEDPSPRIATQKRPARSRGRASIPSWDDILLGSSRAGE